MARDLTAEEIEQKYIHCMGKNLGEIFYAIWQEIASLSNKWNEYVTLFGTKPSRIDILNNSAPSFFRIVQDTLWENIILHIAKVSDPVKSCGKDNLTIQKFTEFIADPGKVEIRTLINNAITKTDFCRDWRNRRIAHLDLNLAIDKEVIPLESAIRQKIKDALDSIFEVLNAISRLYSVPTCKFEYSIPSTGNAMSLLYILCYGLEHKKERQARKKRGEYQEADHTCREL